MLFMLNATSKKLLIFLLVLVLVFGILGFVSAVLSGYIKIPGYVFYDWWPNSVGATLCPDVCKGTETTLFCTGQYKDWDADPFRHCYYVCKGEYGNSCE